MGRRARPAHLEHVIADSLGSRRVVVTGAGGQLGAALLEAFPRRARLDARRLGRDDAAARARRARPRPARRRVDRRRRRRGRSAGRGRGERRRHAARAELGAPLVYFSTDYVFDGTKRTPYVESDAPSPQSAYGRTKLNGEAAAGEDAWIVRTSWLFGWTGNNFVRTMLRARRGARRGRGRRRPARLADVRRASRGSGARARRASARALASRRRRRLHVGGVRGGDLRGGRARRAACGGSRPRSSGARRRGRRTPCCGASVRRAAAAARGATACARASTVFSDGAGRRPRRSRRRPRRAGRPSGGTRSRPLRAPARRRPRATGRSPRARAAPARSRAALRQLEAVHPRHREIDERDVRDARRRASSIARSDVSAAPTISTRSSWSRSARERLEEHRLVVDEKHANRHSPLRTRNRGVEAAGRALPRPLQLSVLLRVPLAALEDRRDRAVSRRRR